MTKKELYPVSLHKILKKDAAWVHMYQSGILKNFLVLFNRIFLNSTKRQNFRLVQIASICRKQNKCESEIEICFKKRVENIVEKRENAGYQHFLLFPQCFQKVSFSRSLKFEIVWERVNLKIIQLLIG